MSDNEDRGPYRCTAVPFRIRMVDSVLSSASHIIIHRVISIGKYQIIRKSTSIIRVCVRKQINNPYILDFDLYRNEHWLMLD